MNSPSTGKWIADSTSNDNRKLRLSELRRKRGITRQKLALDLNMAQNSVSRYENGEREADYKTLILFADYFNVSVDYLLGRTDNPKMNE